MLTKTHAAWGFTWPQWVNSLRPSYTIWWHRSGSTLAQVMAWCRQAPSHYLNQCWLIISKVPLDSSDGNIIRIYLNYHLKNQLENYESKISFKSPRGQWVKHQVINSHGVDHCLLLGRILNICPMSVSRNYLKCKYINLFPKISLTCKRLFLSK